MLAISRPSITAPLSDADKALMDIDATVAGSSTEDIDTVALADFCSMKYKLCVFNVANDVWRSFEFYTTKKSGGAVEDTMYSVIGDVIDFDVEFLVVATDAVLRITNNEIFALTVEGTRII